MKPLTSLDLLERMSRVENMLLIGEFIVESSGDQSNMTMRRKVRFNISLVANLVTGHIVVATMMAMQDHNKGDTRRILRKVET